MKKYKVCVYVVTSTANYIEIEANSEDEATMQAQSIWYEDDRAFSSKLLDESVEDITTEEI